MKERLLTLAEAVRKMTSFAAGVLGIPDRGTVQANMMADLIIFDPEKVRETATYPDPLRLADGFDVVIVNGKVARENGAMDAALHGRVLKPE
jgi:N-acyl-D-aspartate/D-glutamate deacylase